MQQNLCNKPRGSGEGEICGFPRFEGHWLRVQRKASICSKNCVINCVVPERGKFRISKVRGPLVRVVRRGGNFWISSVRKPLIQIAAKSTNSQHNLCNKPRGSGEGEICGFPGFEGHWSRFQRKAPICSKTCVINRVVPERGKFLDFQGSRATGPDFSEKRQFATKPV